LPDDASTVVNDRVEKLLGLHRADASPARFRGEQYDLGLAWVWFPPGYGGLGLDADLQEVIDDRVAEVGIAPFEETSGIGVAMSAPTLIAYGTDDQKQRHLRRIFTGEEIWCQLFSEPGSGSDLAGLSTRAERDGDEWVINGQKVWTSFASIADWALCLARHDPELPKHRGLTYFMVNMHAPGIEIRPLREMTGESQFSEVFLTDVRIPDSQRVGPIGEGWRASMTTLANERAGRGDLLGARAIDQAMRIWRERGSADPVRRDRLTDLWLRSEVTRLLTLRATLLRQAGTTGPESSVAKLASAELGQAIYSFCLDLMGADGMRFPDTYEPLGMARGRGHMVGRSVEWMFLRSRGFTIEGGTAQVQRNVLAERMLGLPGEPWDDRTIPWSQISRN